MATIYKALLMSICINLAKSMHWSAPIKTWTVYHTLPPSEGHEGFTGAMASYNNTSETITIVSPNAPYGKAFLNFYIDSLKFKSFKYPSSQSVDDQVTNDFVAIEDMIYFINKKWNELNAFSITQQKFISLHWILPVHYSQNPCLTKSNDNKYIFILGGANNNGEYFNTFYIYDISNKILKGKLNLPYRLANFGCYVNSNDYLYIIGGEYMTNISHTKRQSHEIWSLYTGDLNNLISRNSTLKWILLNNTLSYSPQLPFVTEINNVLYIIGGWDILKHKCSNETNYILFDNNKTNIIPGPLLPYSLCYTVGVNANYEIYLFGGQTTENDADPTKPLIWMKTNYLGPPTLAPTNPTYSPTKAPTHSPTQSPTRSPTHSPTIATDSPTHSPTRAPTDSPTKHTLSPTRPTNSPTRSPTNSPTNSPTHAPTLSPTYSPTKHQPMKKEHSTEYWAFMSILIGICIVLLCGASIWLYTKYKQNKQQRLVYANDRNALDDPIHT
eukprot:421506_1